RGARTRGGNARLRAGGRPHRGRGQPGGAAPAPGDTACLSWLDRGGWMIDTRRQFIAAIGALGATALVPGCAAMREARERRLVDTHHHFYAPEYQKAWLDWDAKRSIPLLPQQGGWSPAR